MILRRDLGLASYLSTIFDASSKYLSGISEMMIAFVPLFLASSFEISLNILELLKRNPT